MNPAPKPSSEQVEASEAPVSPEQKALPDGQGKEAGRILFGLAVLGVGLLAANRGRE